MRRPPVPRHAMTDTSGDGDPTDESHSSASTPDPDDGTGVRAGESDADRERPPDATESADDTRRASDGGGPSWLYLVGLLGFFTAGVAFVADLVTGHDVLRSVALNALTAVLLVTWAGLDSYRDRSSGVQTIPGAVGTGLILIGVYLLVAGAVVGVTSLVHERLFVGLGMLAGGVPLVLGGFLVFPADAVLGPGAEDEADRTAAGAREEEERG